MSHYTAPVEDMGFVLKEVVGLEKVCEEAGLDTSTVDIIETVLDAAGKLAKEEIFKYPKHTKTTLATDLADRPEISIKEDTIRRDYLDKFPDF